MLLQADDKILFHAGNDAIGRLNADGSPDDSFGEQGLLVVRHSSGIAIRVGPTADIALQLDGKILISASEVSRDKSSGAVVIRLNRNGTIDSSFADAGLLRPHVSGPMLVDAQGRILFSSVTESQPAIVRYLADGTIDDLFRAEIPDSPLVDGFFEWIETAVDTSGRVIVVGSIVERTQAISMLRFDDQGGCDKEFSQNASVALRSALGVGRRRFCFQEARIGFAVDGDVLVSARNTQCSGFELVKITSGATPHCAVSNTNNDGYFTPLDILLLMNHFSPATLGVASAAGEGHVPDQSPQEHDSAQDQSRSMPIDFFDTFQERSSVGHALCDAVRFKSRP